MKLTALLSWYDEDPSWLAACIVSLKRLDVDHLVALDGAYMLFPEGEGRSGVEQHRMIAEACHALGIGLTLQWPDHSWVGNEVEKRTHLFRLADSTDADWYLVVDADSTVTTTFDVKARLAETDLDAAEVMLWEREPHRDVAEQFYWPPVSSSPLRCFYRAIPGLHMVENHYTVTTPDGRRLWGKGGLEPALDLTDVRIEHRTQRRAVHRRDQAKAYYRLRDKLGVELGQCARCDRQASLTLPVEWERLTDHELTASWIEVCPAHALDVRKETDRQLRAWGHDPATVNVTPRKLDRRAAA